MSLLGVVLSGGASSRMGSDKARIVLQDVPLVARMVNALMPECDEVVVSVDGFKFQDLGLNEIVDPWPGLGPMSGLLAGLKVATDLGFDEVFLTSCDLFGFDPDWISLLPVGENSAFFDSCWQPMVSRWQIKSLDILPKESLGIWRALELVEALRVTPPAAWNGAFSINTPEDLIRAQSEPNAK